MDASNQLIGIHGLAGSGKTEVSNHLCLELGYFNVKFAGPLKSMIGTLLVKSGVCQKYEVNQYLEGDLKEIPIPQFDGKSPRDLMQTLGTEWGRGCVSQTLWVDAWKGLVSRVPSNVVTDDVRFENEAAMIRDRGGRIIHLYRADLARNAPQHVSETQLEVLPGDFTVWNSEGIFELHQKINQIAHSLRQE